MGILKQVRHWSATHHPKWLVVLRVVLGICLLIKGISFISDTAQLQLILAEGHFTQSFPWLSYIITWIHLFGGFLIIIGLLTKFAVALQIPILLGAVFFININDGIFSSSPELWLSIVILLSLDNYFKKNPK
jgi:putative oxidoreductase